MGTPFFHSFPYSLESAPSSGITCPHIPGHLLAPANFLGCPQVPFHCPPGLRLAPGGPNEEPELLAAFEVGPRWPEAGGRDEGPLGRGGVLPFSPHPSPSPLGPCPRAHQWQQQARHGGEAHDRPAVASYSPIRAQAVAAAAAESGMCGPAGSQEQPGPRAGELRWRLE